MMYIMSKKGNIEVGVIKSGSCIIMWDIIEGWGFAMLCSTFR